MYRSCIMPTYDKIVSKRFNPNTQATRTTTELPWFFDLVKRKSNNVLGHQTWPKRLPFVVLNMLAGVKV
eukprot:1303067-Amphidinium_carterae.1